MEALQKLMTEATEWAQDTFGKPDSNGVVEHVEKEYKQALTLEYTMPFPAGPQTITMQEKALYEINDCEIGKAIVLNLRNGDVYTGLFKGMDGDEVIMLGALSGSGRIGLKVNWLENYLEQVVNIDNISCKIDDWSCPYHDCMSDRCAHINVTQVNQCDFGVSFCLK